MAYSVKVARDSMSLSISSNTAPINKSHQTTLEVNAGNAEKIFIYFFRMELNKLRLLSKTVKQNKMRNSLFMLNELFQGILVKNLVTP